MRGRTPGAWAGREPGTREGSHVSAQAVLGQLRREGPTRERAVASNRRRGTERQKGQAASGSARFPAREAPAVLPGPQIPAWPRARRDPRGRRRAALGPLLADKANKLNSLLPRVSLLPRRVRAKRGATARPRPRPRRGGGGLCPSGNGCGGASASRWRCGFGGRWSSAGRTRACPALC